MLCKFKAPPLPHLMIYGAIFCFLVDASLNIIQLSYLQNYNVNQMDSMREVLVLQYRIEKQRLDVSRLIASIFVSVATFLLIKYLWLKTKNNYIFTLVILIINLFLLEIPFNYFEEEYINKKYLGSKGFTRSTFSSLISLAMSSYIGDALMIAITSLVIKITHLERQPEENDPMDQNENPEHRQPFCHGKFWIIMFIGPAILITIITSYLPAILMMEGENAFQHFNLSDTGIAIKNLTDTVGFPFKDVYISFSARDAGSPNAYFSGIAVRRIMVTETLLKVVDTPKAVAVVGHELGHFKHGDIIRGLLMSLALQFATALCLLAVQKRGLGEFGLGAEMPAAVVLLVAAGLSKPTAAVLQPLVNTALRSFERGADCFAAALGLPIAEALQAITRAAGDTAGSAALFSAYYEAHPTIPERIAHIATCRPK